MSVRCLSSMVVVVRGLSVVWPLVFPRGGGGGGGGGCRHGSQFNYSHIGACRLDASLIVRKWCDGNGFLPVPC